MSAARSKDPAAPKHLSASSRALWRRVLDDYELDATALATLRVGLEALDRAEELRQAVSTAGAVIPDRYGVPRPHPAIQAEHTCRTDFLRCMRELALGPGAGEDLSRPPPIPGRYDE